MAVVFDKEHIEALKKTKELVGFLYPALREKGSNLILSGRHRKSADPNWPELEIEVKDPMQRELIILFSNVQRPVSEEELKFRLNRVAGAMANLMQIPDETVCDQLCKVLSPKPYSERRIQQVLDERWKQKTCPKKTEMISVSPELQNLKKEAEEIKHITTALDAETFSEEDPRPFKDCRCKLDSNNLCSHFKTDCY